MSLFEQLRQRIAQRRAAARQEREASTRTPSIAPLQEITGVALNPALTGGNAATQSFYFAPENAQSQFAIGAPVGGGGIGPRQRASTDNLTSTPDTLGSKKKDEF